MNAVQASSSLPLDAVVAQSCGCGESLAGEGASKLCGCGGSPALEDSAVRPSATGSTTAPVAATVPAGVTASAPSVPVASAQAPGVALAQPPDEPQRGQAVEPYVYVLCALDYDFGTEARRDTFKQTMGPAQVDDTTLPANPYDARQMVGHLRDPGYVGDAEALIWTLNLELTPVYAVEPVGPYAASIYQRLVDLLAAQIEPADKDDYIERVAIPGRLTGRTVRLFSGQVVPVVEVDRLSGIFGWQVNHLIRAAIRAVSRELREEGARPEAAVRTSLREILDRIYYDLRNLGATARDRALNYAATNAFQLAALMAQPSLAGQALDTIGVEKSPFCRLDSDCWDVKLRFFDPDQILHARRVYRFTVDVSDMLPVTVGQPREWSEAP
jgi:cyanobactin maturation PatA/PatG family protease